MHLKMDIKLLFHLPDLSIMNNFILLSSLQLQIIPNRFQTCLGQDLTQEDEREQLQTTPWGRQTPPCKIMNSSHKKGNESSVM
jgi:hypothetical protein